MATETHLTSCFSIPLLQTVDARGCSDLHGWSSEDKKNPESKLNQPAVETICHKSNGRICNILQPSGSSGPPTTHFLEGLLTLAQNYSLFISVKREMDCRNNETCLNIHVYTLGYTTCWCTQKRLPSGHYGWLTPVTPLLFTPKFWLNWSFIGSISNALAGTCFDGVSQRLITVPWRGPFVWLSPTAWPSKLSAQAGSSWHLFWQMSVLILP